MDPRFLPSDYTVLVVDGDPRDSADLKALLERAGYRARTFRSGEALLEDLPACGENCCLIAEVELPGMTGLELISRLRQDNILAPAVILTRLGDVPTAVRAMRADVADYLTKPYVERDLIDRLRSALLRQRARLH
ncbi:MAG: response regulator [Gammaproteobacteria bacterium]|nr:response regulator [Gammaproteobacteria bacterium]